MEPESAKCVQWFEAWQWAKRVAMGVEIQVRQIGQIESWADMWTRAVAEAKAPLQTREWEVREQHAQARSQAQLLAVVEAYRGTLDLRSQAQARALARCARRLQQAEAEERVHIMALALAGAWGWTWAEARKRGESVPSAVADSSIIRDILSSLHHNRVAHHLWHNSPEGRDEYLCIINFIAPITRLPFELFTSVTQIRHHLGPH